MAVLMMAHQNTDNKNTESGKKPTFHDFLGMKCGSDTPVIVVPKQSIEIRLSEASSSGGGHGPVSVTSDLGSERLVGNHPEGVQMHGPKSDFSGPEISNRLAGSKRSNSDSAFMGSARDRMPQLGPDAVENSHLMKLIRSSTGGDRLRSSHNEELFFGMQPPRQTSTNPLILQPPGGSRPDSVASKWHRALHAIGNAGPTAHYPPRHGQFATYVDKISSNKYRDGNAGPSIISQPAADEGSRTGIKGSSLLNGINASSSILERNSSRVVLSSTPKYGPPIVDPESSNPPSQVGLMSGSRQMTIFYAGQAHVFDDVHPNKADVIMSLAGSNGGSWSTSYSPKSSAKAPIGETCLPSAENELGMSNLALPRELRGKLTVPGSSSHVFNKDGQILATPGGPLSLPSGGYQGSMIVRETRPPPAQAAKPDTEGKREAR